MDLAEADALDLAEADALDLVEADALDLAKTGAPCVDWHRLTFGDRHKRDGVGVSYDRFTSSGVSSA